MLNAKHRCSADGAVAEARPHTAAARTSASASSSSQPAQLTLHGGVPHHPALAGLWHDERLTGFAVSAARASSI